MSAVNSASDTPPRQAEQPGPTELRNPLVRTEMARAGIWLGMAVAIGLVILLAQPILLILAGIVLAAMLDGGARLLGRVLPIGRGWRLGIVLLASLGFLAWVAVLAGAEIAGQAAALQSTLFAQIGRVTDWAASYGFHSPALDPQALGEQVMGSMGRVTAAVGTVVGGVTSAVMVLVLGIFMAAEPRLYERGVAWMLPIRHRDGFYRTTSRMGSTLRRLMAGRLLGMAIEGVGTWLLLLVGGVPMAALLGLLTGLLAFIPNVGAIISGALLILVGFSAGTDTGIYAIGVYFVVQTIDGYLIVPIVARRSVDLAPALVLGAQILFGALFGILGLALADPIIAMIKAALEEEADKVAEAEVPAEP